MPCVLDARHCHFDAKTLNGLTLQMQGCMKLEKTISGKVQGCMSLEKTISMKVQGCTFIETKVWGKMQRCTLPQTGGYHSVC